jgi:hypothetical protein
MKPVIVLLTALLSFPASGQGDGRSYFDVLEKVCTGRNGSRLFTVKISSRYVNGIHYIYRGVPVYAIEVLVRNLRPGVQPSNDAQLLFDITGAGVAPDLSSFSTRQRECMITFTAPYAHSPTAASIYLHLQELEGEVPIFDALPFSCVSPESMQKPKPME